MSSFPKRKVVLEIPEQWIDSLMTIPIDPNDADAQDTLEERLYFVILEEVDRIVMGAYRERDDGGGRLQ